MARASRVVAITGASSGIGRATAIFFAQRGWDVGLIARTNDGLQDTARDAQRAGARTCVAIADVADDKAVDDAANRIEQSLGPIEVWVNDAGISMHGRFSEMSDEEFRRVTDVTYLGAVNGTRAALRRMRPRNRGSIVNVASRIAWHGMPLQSPYSGAKYALRGFVEAVRGELTAERSRIHLGMVYPPGVSTPFYVHAGARMKGLPSAPPPMIQPEMVAEAIWRSANDHVRNLKLTNPTVLTKWANALMPAAMDWLMGRVGIQAQTTQRPGARADRNVTLSRPQPHPPRLRAEGRAVPARPRTWIARHPGITLALLGGALALFLPRRAARSVGDTMRHATRRVPEATT